MPRPKTPTLTITMKCVGCGTKYTMQAEKLRGVGAPCCGIDTGGGGCGSPLVAVSATAQT